MKFRFCANLPNRDHKAKISFRWKNKFDTSYNFDCLCFEFLRRSVEVFRHQNHLMPYYEWRVWHLWSVKNEKKVKKKSLELTKIGRMALATNNSYTFFKLYFIWRVVVSLDMEKSSNEIIFLFFFHKGANVKLVCGWVLQRWSQTYTLSEQRDL